MRSCHTVVASSYEILVNTLIKNNPRDQRQPSTGIPVRLCSLHFSQKFKLWHQPECPSRSVRVYAQCKFTQHL